MRELKVLHLTLKKRWFNMIASGVKKEEYREIKDYWSRRLERLDDNDMIGGYNEFDVVEFRNGYSKYAQSMMVECEGITIGRGKPEWGAPDKPVFIIKLGRVVAYTAGKEK